MTRDVGYIADSLIENVRRVIADSNRASLERHARYVHCENRALHADYEFIACQCEDSCWCKRNACAGHYQLREMTFERFLETYVCLWTPPPAREAVKRAVSDGTPVNRRYKNAPPALWELRNKWPGVLAMVKSFTKCGLCDSAEPAIPHIGNLYEAKIWSQLFYDSVEEKDQRRWLPRSDKGFQCNEPRTVPRPEKALREAQIERR